MKAMSSIRNWYMKVSAMTWLKFRSWWQKASKALSAVIVTPLVALLRIMVSRFRSWWQNTSKKRKIAQIIVLVVVVGLIVSFIGGYFFNWTWTGFGPYTPPTSGLQRGKSLYDWLQLAIIPAAIAFGVWLLNRLQQQRDQQLADDRAQTERDIALDNQREAALQAYLDCMTELLLEKGLRKSVDNDEVRTIAHVRTLRVLPRLDGGRRSILLEFLKNTGLINKSERIVDLSGADLSEVRFYCVDLGEIDLCEANLHEADLSISYLADAMLCDANLSGANLFQSVLSKANLMGADLSRTNLSGADLCETSLIEANLSGANLREAELNAAKLSFANLSGADLTGANLSNADLTLAAVTTEQLDKAKSLKGTTMPDGTKHA